MQYIAKHHLYAPADSHQAGHAPDDSATEPRDRVTATDRAVELVRRRQAASDKLAENIMAFDVSEQLVITDAFLLCSACNDRQVKAIVDEIEDRLREIGAKPCAARASATAAGCSSTTPTIVVHVQHEEEREFYALERLWRDCPLIALPAT